MFQRVYRTQVLFIFIIKPDNCVIYVLFNFWWYFKLSEQPYWLSFYFYQFLIYTFLCCVNWSVKLYVYYINFVRYICIYSHDWSWPGFLSLLYYFCELWWRLFITGEGKYGEVISCYAWPPATFLAPFSFFPFLLLPPLSFDTLCPQPKITPVMQRSLVSGDSGGGGVQPGPLNLQAQPHKTYCCCDSPFLGSSLSYRFFHSCYILIWNLTMCSGLSCICIQWNLQKF